MHHKANQVVIENKPAENVVKEIHDLEKISFTPEFQWSENDIRETIQTPSAVVIVSYDENGNVAGYLLAMDLSEEIDDLKEADPEIEDIPGALYLNNIVVRPDMRGKGIFSRMVQKLLQEFPNRTIALHASAANNSSAGMQKNGACFIRRIANWYGHGEPFDYLIFNPVNK